jgi:hypothetical protein
MKKILFRHAIMPVLFLFISQISFSQATRTWVSGVGDDVNPCSRTAPCKTFAGAISKTATGGEINGLDPAGYGAVTITKSMTIDGGGTFASILSAGTNGIIINAGTDGVVTLRNLNINGAGTGINGVRIMAAKKVIIENCFLANFTQKGIEVNTTAPCTVILNNVTIHNAEDAIGMTNENGSVTIDDCRFQAINNAGINLMSGQAIVSRSTISNCGIAVKAAANAGPIASAGNNIIAGNKVQGATMSVFKVQ